MKVKEIMERAGINQTGRAIAYIKDGLEEIELFTKQNVVRGSAVITTGTGIKTTADGNNDAIGGLVDIMWSTPDEQVDDFATGTFGFEDFGMGSDHFTYTATAGTMRFRTFANDYTANGDNVFAVEAESSGGTVSGYMWMPTIITLSPDTWYEYNIEHKSFASSARISVVSSTDTTKSVISDAICTTNTNEIANGATHTGEFRTGDPFIYEDRVLFKTNSTASTVKIGFEIISLATTDPGMKVNDIGIKPVDIKITDNNSRFGSFTDDMKIFINGSKMDTDNSTYAPLGYHTISSASSGTLTLNIDHKYFYPDHTGNSITVRGQTLNYMDIIKDKRFYPLPNDMLKLMDVKIKNHKNGNDKYKSVERAIYAPSEQDGDNV